MKDKEARLLKYITSLEDKLHTMTRGQVPAKHSGHAASLKQFLEREIASAKASLAKAKGL